MSAKVMFFCFVVSSKNETTFYYICAQNITHMIDYSEVTLNQIVVHNIGSRSEEQGVQLSKAPTQIFDETAEDILKTYFLSHFKTEYFYQFVDNEDLQQNAVYDCVSKVFDDNAQFYQQSTNIAWHLYEKSNHPNIKTGEFYMVYFSGIQIDGVAVDAIGIFKSENKDTYIKVCQQDDSYGVEYENGINIKKLDKGCLILNNERETGYQVAIVDSTNRGDEAMYWRESFLNVMPRENEYYQTSQLFDICKNFSHDMLTSQNKVDKADQVTFMKRAEQFFNTNDFFDSEQFKNDVIGNEQVSAAFEDYKRKFENQKMLSPIDQFEISGEAVKRGKKYFRSVIKLDKNFHIYVHANPDYIEKGFDENKGLKFYKLFFSNEE